MLTQCHTRVVKGFMGQTTAFRKSRLKSNVTILAENDAFGEARYIHGKFGLGMWSWYGGHDPEDYRHYVGDPVTELKNHQIPQDIVLSSTMYSSLLQRKKSRRRKERLLGYFHYSKNLHTRPPV